MRPILRREEDIRQREIIIRRRIAFGTYFEEASNLENVSDLFSSLH